MAGNFLGKSLSLLALTLSALPMVALSPSVASAQQTASISRGPSGLPLPRFVSLKSARVNMRVGPGKDYAVSWMYLKSGLPLEIIQEFDNWRRVRDAEGTTGWIHGALLSGNRTAVALPWRKGEKDETVTIYQKPQAGAQALAYIEPGVVTDIQKCDGAWCEVTIKADKKLIDGYTSQANLWGAYPDEKIDE